MIAEVEAEKERLEHDGAALNDKMAAAQHKLAELDEREHRVKTSEVLPHRVPCLHPVPCRRSPCIHQRWHHRRMCGVPSTRCWGSWPRLRRSGIGWPAMWLDYRTRSAACKRN